MAADAIFLFVRNVAERMSITLTSVGAITAIQLDAIQDKITGAAISALDPTTLLPVALPLSLTQSAANTRVWYTQELIISTAGDFVVEFSTDSTPATLLADLTVSSTGSVPYPELSLCSIYGHILDEQGAPIYNTAVSARILAPPVVISNAGISTDIVSARTDVNGYFQFSVLQDTTIDVIITEISYRRTLVVPSSSTASLFDIS